MSQSTTVLARGGFKGLQAQVRALAAEGIDAEIVCPPGTNPNG